MVMTLEPILAALNLKSSKLPKITSMVKIVLKETRYLMRM